MLVKTTYFVDKTLIIKDIFKHSSRLLITAPQQFGKSVNIDMIKRFLAIEVDEATCTPKPVDTTENYKLFKDNNLNICNDEEFFNNHFRKHPVIHIDFKPLGKVPLDRSVNWMEKVCTIVKKSFNQHIYLLHNYNKNLFYSLDPLNENFFKNYFSEGYKSMDTYFLTHCFKHLSQILYRYFKKKVFVLIDNYDAFINSLFFNSMKEANSENNKIINFVDKIIKKLLKNNTCVEQTLLTGMLPLFHTQNFDYYFFTDNNFSKYYGLTCDELDMFLKKLIEDEEERNKTKQKIDENYGYISENRNLQVYSIWSVLQYLHRGEVESYWCNSSKSLRASDVKAIFKNLQIQHKVVLLLMGTELCLTDTLQPLSAKDILQIHDIIASGKYDEHICPLVVNTFFNLLYHLGYLSISSVLGRGYIKVKIPNAEIKHEFAKIILETDSNIFQFFGSHETIDDIRCAVDLFCPGNTKTDKHFLTFLQLVTASWSTVELKYKIAHFLNSLFVILMTRPEYNQTILKKITLNDSVLVQLRNKHQVNIFITAKEAISDNLTHKTLLDLALDAHDQMTEYICTESLSDKSADAESVCDKSVDAESVYNESADAESVCNESADAESVCDKFADLPYTVLIVIAYGHYYDKQLKYSGVAAYSYRYKEGDTLTNAKTFMLKDA